MLSEKIYTFLTLRSSKLNTLVTKLLEFLDYSPEKESVAAQINEIFSGNSSLMLLLTCYCFALVKFGAIS